MLVKRKKNQGSLSQITSGIWSFICIKSTPLHPRILCAKYESQYAWNWPCGSICSFTIWQISPIGKRRWSSLHLNKFQSHQPWDVLSQIWLKLIQSLWRKRFLNVVNVFFLILLYSVLLFLWTILNSLDPRMLCAKFGWN